jgi:hypothetical protein
MPNHHILYIELFVKLLYDHNFKEAIRPASYQYICALTYECGDPTATCKWAH